VGDGRTARNGGQGGTGPELIGSGAFPVVARHPPEQPTGAPGPQESNVDVDVAQPLIRPPGSLVPVGAHSNRP
jgi:hypothetical protein